MTTRTRKFDSRDLSPSGWYVASYLERFTVLGESKQNLKRKFLTWENTILVKAKNPEQAYKKAISHAKQSEIPYTNPDGKKVKWKVEGLTSLVPVYEELEDGAEIIWKNHGMKTLKSVRKRAKKKRELEVFRKDA